MTQHCVWPEIAALASAIRADLEPHVHSTEARMATDVKFAIAATYDQAHDLALFAAAGTDVCAALASANTTIANTLRTLSAARAAWYAQRGHGAHPAEKYTAALTNLIERAGEHLAGPCEAADRDAMRSKDAVYHAAGLLTPTIGGLIPDETPQAPEVVGCPALDTEVAQRCAAAAYRGYLEALRCHESIERAAELADMHWSIELTAKQREQTRAWSRAYIADFGAAARRIAEGEQRAGLVRVTLNLITAEVAYAASLALALGSPRIAADGSVSFTTTPALASQLFSYGAVAEPWFQVAITAVDDEDRDLVDGAVAQWQFAQSARLAGVLELCRDLQTVGTSV